MAPVWGRFVNHPFVMAMGNGTLPLDSFKGYLVQDYLYLVSFAQSVLNIEVVNSLMCRYNLLEPTL